MVEKREDKKLKLEKKEKKCKLSSITNKITVERIFRPRTQL